MGWGMSDALREARQQQITDAIDGGPAAGTLTIYDGVQPANGGAETTTLVVVTLNDPSSTVTGPVFSWSVDPVPEGTAVADGDATWGRFKDSTGAIVMDGAVGSEILLDNASIATGQKVRFTGGTLTEPNGGAA